VKQCSAERIIARNKQVDNNRRRPVTAASSYEIQAGSLSALSTETRSPTFEYHPMFRLVYTSTFKFRHFNPLRANKPCNPALACIGLENDENRDEFYKLLSHASMLVFDFAGDKTMWGDVDLVQACIDQTRERLGRPKGSVINAATWMADEFQDAKFKDLVIPATHNSGCINSVRQWKVQEKARCQSKSIKEQLELGIRSLDIRISLQKDEEVRVVHPNPIPQLQYAYETAKVVFEDIQNFLNGTSEAVILFIKDQSPKKSRGNSNKKIGELLEKHLGKWIARADPEHSLREYTINSLRSRLAKGGNSSAGTEGSPVVVVINKKHINLDFAWDDPYQGYYTRANKPVRILAGQRREFEAWETEVQFYSCLTHALTQNQATCSSDIACESFSEETCSALNVTSWDIDPRSGSDSRVIQLTVGDNVKYILKKIREADRLKNKSVKDKYKDRMQDGRSRLQKIDRVITFKNNSLLQYFTRGKKDEAAWILAKQDGTEFFARSQGAVQELEFGRRDSQGGMLAYLINFLYKRNRCRHAEANEWLDAIQKDTSIGSDDTGWTYLVHVAELANNATGPLQDQDVLRLDCKGDNGDTMFGMTLRIVARTSNRRGLTGHKMYEVAKLLLDPRTDDETIEQIPSDVEKQAETLHEVAKSTESCDEHPEHLQIREQVHYLDTLAWASLILGATVSLRDGSFSSEERESSTLPFRFQYTMADKSIPPITLLFFDSTQKSSLGCALMSGNLTVTFIPPVWMAGEHNNVKLIAMPTTGTTRVVVGYTSYSIEGNNGVLRGGDRAPGILFKDAEGFTSLSTFTSTLKSDINVLGSQKFSLTVVMYDGVDAEESYSTPGFLGTYEKGECDEFVFVPRIDFTLEHGKNFSIADGKDTTSVPVSECAEECCP